MHHVGLVECIDSGAAYKYLNLPEVGQHLPTSSGLKAMAS